MAIPGHPFFHKTNGFPPEDTVFASVLTMDGMRVFDGVTALESSADIDTQHHIWQKGSNQC